MDDILRRELAGIGTLLRGLLRRVTGRHGGQTDEEPLPTGAELAARHGIDLGVLLAEERPAEWLARHGGLSEPQTELFAEWLASLAAAAEGDERLRLAATACDIYKYLDARGAPASPARLYILRELASYKP